MEYKDYYKTLGIDKKATQDDVKKAFRALAIKYHPDKNPDNKASEEKFKLINEANEVLSNPEKRKQYDELGENWKQTQQTGTQGNGNPFGRNSTNGQYGEENPKNGFGSKGEGGFSDFFEQFFGGQQQNRNANRTSGFKGGDYETEMEITLEEAYQGTSRIIQLENEKLRVTTKPGAYTDQLLRIKGKGAKGSNEVNRGDLLVRVKVKPNQSFTRKGNDLYATHNIDFYTAVLGGEIIVKTLLAQLKIKIAEGTQNGLKVRLKGKGMPIYEKSDVFGDLYIEVHVQIPDKLTNKQKELFQQLKLTVQ